MQASKHTRVLSVVLAHSVTRLIPIRTSLGVSYARDDCRRNRIPLLSPSCSREISGRHARLAESVRLPAKFYLNPHICHSDFIAMSNRRDFFRKFTRYQGGSLVPMHNNQLSLQRLPPNVISLLLSVFSALFRFGGGK